MSRTTVFRIKHDGQVEVAFEQHNAWLHAPKIWEALFKKYCLKPTDHEYASWLQYSDRLWALQSDDRLSRAERIALLATFDRIWVPREMIPEVAEAFAHLGGSIVGLAGMVNEAIRGVCFQGTSVSENLWSRNDEEGGLINIDRDPCCNGKKPWCLAEDLAEVRR